MVTFPNPNGGSMTVANEAEARSRGWTPSMGSFGVNSYPTGGGGGGGATSITPQAGSNQSDILNAFSAGSGFSIKQLDEQKREFDAQLAQAKEQMERIGIPQLAIQQRLADAQQAMQQFQMLQAGQNQAMAEGQLTGSYQPLNIDYPSFMQQLFSSILPTGATSNRPADGTFVKDANGPEIGVMQGGQLHRFGTWAEFLAAGGQPNQWTNLPTDQYRALQTTTDPQATIQKLLAGITRGPAVQTEAASEYARSLAEQQRQYNQNLGLQYLTQASQFAASDPFQLSDFMRGAAASNSNLPTFLQNLQNNVAGSAAGNVGPEPAAATTLPMLSAAMQGQGQPINPQGDSALNAIGGIYQRGANQLGTGTLEGLDANELNTLQQGITRLYGAQAAPAFMAAYARSRPQQTAARTSYQAA